MAEIFKISEGYVEQVFDQTGKCIRQKFVAGNSEIENTDALNADVSYINLYFPFDMTQLEND